MADAFKVVRQGAVLEIVLEPGAVHGPSVVRDGLKTALTDVPHDVAAVLIRSGAAGFVPEAAVPGPDVAEVCAALAQARVPVFFLIEGVVTGALAEVALASHARLSTPEGRMALGAISVGRISGAGGTQRLARLIGAEQALRLMRSGQAVAAPEALALGLMDAVIEGEDRAAVIEAARVRAAQGFARSASAGLRDARGFLAAVAQARAAEPPPPRAELALVDCIEAALLLPPEQGLAFEATVAADLAASPEAAALAHIYTAERAAAQMPAPLGGFAPAPVAHLGLVWAAMPLVGLVLAALSRGVSVTLAEPDRDALVAFLKAVAARQEAMVQAGQRTEAQRDADWARLVTVADAAGLQAAGLVILADGADAPPGSSARPVLVLGRGPLPQGAFRLTLAGRVAELAVPPGTLGPAAAQALGFLRKAGLTAVMTGAQSAAGLAGRLGAASGAAVRAMVGMGVPPGDVAAALVGFGLPRPPATEAADIPPRAMDGAEIVQRWLGAMANEGARLLAAGMALSARDIDLVAVHGLGFPRARGGPLHQADQRGLLILRRDLTRWADDAEVWRPVPAWDALVSAGRFMTTG